MPACTTRDSYLARSACVTDSGMLTYCAFSLSSASKYVSMRDAASRSRSDSVLAESFRKNGDTFSSAMAPMTWA